MIRRPNPRWPWLVIVFATAALAFLRLHPVASTVTRLAGLGAGVMLWGGLVMLGWRRRVLRAALLLLPVVLAAPFCLPARLIHPLRLRTDMMGRLRALEGVLYVWGGESARGIDCSGFPARRCGTLCSRRDFAPATAERCGRRSHSGGTTPAPGPWGKGIAA
ncbi:MAG: hypothetical protein U1G05_11245 [Kiritimatiellia bacterium]